MLKQRQLRITQYNGLYEAVVPQDHLLRRIKDTIDFSFVNGMLKKQYCEAYGRPATEPEMMFKLMLLKKLYDLSDEALIQTAQTDMAYKFFLDINPEDKLVDASLMTKFRKTRITEEILNDMLRETVHQAVEKGIIKSNAIIVDSTHTTSSHKQKTATGVLRSLSHDLRYEIYKHLSEISDNLPSKPSLESTLEEEIKYTKALLEYTRNSIYYDGNTKLINLHKKLETSVEDPEIERIRTECDMEARVGYKGAGSFLGYKNHLAMTEEGIIAAIEVTSGEVGDGTYLEKLVEKAETNGIEVREVIGDMAYSGHKNADYCAEKKITLISKTITGEYSEFIKDGFIYNKDIKGLVCPADKVAPIKQYKEQLIFTYNKSICEGCELASRCRVIKEKQYTITMPTEIRQQRIDFQNSEYFKRRIKERYKIEQKNAELKNVHGLKRTDSKGKIAMKVQSFITGVAANVKRITKLTNNGIILSKNELQMV